MSAPPQDRPRDPARSLRAIGAAILGTHAIMVGLSVPVVLDHGAPDAGVAGLTAIAILDVVAAGLLRRAERAMIVLGSLLLAGTVAAGVMSGFLLFLGVLFGGLWIAWLAMRRSFAAALAAAAEEGDPGPDPPPRPDPGQDAGPGAGPG